MSAAEECGQQEGLAGGASGQQQGSDGEGAPDAADAEAGRVTAARSVGDPGAGAAAEEGGADGPSGGGRGAVAAAPAGRAIAGSKRGRKQQPAAVAVIEPQPVASTREAGKELAAPVAVAVAVEEADADGEPIAQPWAG